MVRKPADEQRAGQWLPGPEEGPGRWGWSSWVAQDRRPGRVLPGVQGWAGVPALGLLACPCSWVGRTPPVPDCCCSGALGVWPEGRFLLHGALGTGLPLSSQGQLAPGCPHRRSASISLPQGRNSLQRTEGGSPCALGPGQGAQVRYLHPSKSCCGALLAYGARCPQGLWDPHV